LHLAALLHVATQPPPVGRVVPDASLNVLYELARKRLDAVHGLLPFLFDTLSVPYCAQPRR